MGQFISREGRVVVTSVFASLFSPSPIVTGFWNKEPRLCDVMATGRAKGGYGGPHKELNVCQEEIKSRLKLGNACYYSVQNLLSSSLLSKKLKIKIYRTIILPVVQYGCETWSLTLREERRLRVFANRMVRRVFGSKRDEVTGE